MHTHTHEHDTPLTATCSDRTPTFSFTSYNRRCITSFRYPELSRGLRLVSRSNRFIVDIVVSLSDSHPQSDGGCMSTCTFIHLKSANLYMCTIAYVQVFIIMTKLLIGQMWASSKLLLCLSVAPYWKCAWCEECLMGDLGLRCAEVKAKGTRWFVSVWPSFFWTFFYSHCPLYSLN